MDYAAFSSRYKDREYVGSGGFAKVYKVFDHAKNHYVALKIADVRPEWKQFTLQREVELVNNLDYHRNIARYDNCYRFNTGITGEVDFAVLKFYEYGNLEQFLTREEVTDADKRIIIKGILEGTAFLHRNDITHRDLKAQNILLNREDGVWVPKIIDFGLARQFGGSHTMTNSSIGISYAYAAPEQIQNKRIQKNVDLWAVGVIVYRIIAGELPFQTEGDGRSHQSQLELSRRIVNLELPAKLDTLPDPYRAIIKRCLVLEPNDRAQNAEELLGLLAGDRPATIPSQPSFTPTDAIPAAEATEIIRPEVKRPSTPSIPPATQYENVQPAGLSVPPPPPPSPARASIPPMVPPSVPAPSAPIGPPAMPPVSPEIHNNPTQFIARVPPPPPPTPVMDQRGGDAQSGIKWYWPVLGLLLISLLGGGFFAWQQGWLGGNARLEQSLTTATPTIVQQGDGLIIEKMRAKNEAARGDYGALDAVFLELQSSNVPAAQQFQLHYLSAKNRVYRGDYMVAEEMLTLARSAATSAGQEESLGQLFRKDRLSRPIQRYEQSGGSWQ